MRKAVSFIFAVGTLCFSSVAHAGAGWTDYVKVAELVPTNHHYYAIRLPVKENPSGCKKKDWFYQDYGSRGSNEMYQAILEGLKSGIKIRVYVTGKCNLHGYSEFSSVSLTP